MTPEMTDHIEFTREDAERITRMETLMIGMNTKIDVLTESIGACQSNCVGRRSKFDDRLKAVENTHLEDKGFLKGRTADVALIVGVLGVVGALISIWEVFG
jgi:hypothetical protein